MTRDQLRALRRGEQELEDEPPAPAKEAAPPGRRITYRSGTGITLTLYLNRDEITVPEIQQTLREAIEEATLLRGNAQTAEVGDLSRWPAAIEAAEHARTVAPRGSLRRGFSRP